MSGDVALTSALRNNLLSLQTTQRQIDVTQSRLATGKKVNSALDNPLNFFRSQSFQDRASDLTTLLDGINLSIRTIQEADKGVSAITDLLNTAESIVEQATAAYNGASTNIGVISGLATAGGFAGTGTALNALTGGGISGFSVAGDTIVFEIEGSGVNGGNGTTITIAGDDTIQDIRDAFNTDSGLIVTYDDTTGELSIDVRDASTTGLSGIESVKVTVTDSADDDYDPEVNFGGSIVRDSSGQSELYAGISKELENLEERYNKIRTEISAVANDANFNGINLLKGNELLTNFNEKGTSNLITVGEDLTTAGLEIDFADFSTRDLVDDSASQIDEALTTVRNFGATLATDISLIQTRQTFTRETIETLKAGSDDLTLADLNEEGANLLALQTRQQLGITSLSLASQAQQSVLRLF